MLALTLAVGALLLPAQPGAPPAAAAVSRRMAFQVASAAAATAFGIRGANAAEQPSKMGGLLEPFIDVQRGYKLYKPSGWSQVREGCPFQIARAPFPSIQHLRPLAGRWRAQFEADPGVYDIKFQDIIEPETTVQVDSDDAAGPGPSMSPRPLLTGADQRQSLTLSQVSSSPVQTATSISALGDLQTVGTKFATSRNAKLISSNERDSDGSLVYTFELEGDMYHELLALSINRGKLYRLTTVTSNKKWKKREELYKNIVLSFVPKGF